MTSPITFNTHPAARLVIALLLLVITLPAWGALPTLIPREVLFAAAEHRSPKFSPDGTQIAYLAPDAQQTLQLWVRATGQADDRMLTRITGGKISAFCWAPDGNYLYFLRDHDGDEHWQACMLALDGGTVTPLTPDGVTAGDLMVFSDSPDDLFLRAQEMLYRYHFDRETGVNQHLGFKLPTGTREWDMSLDTATIACLRNLPGGMQSLDIFALSAQGLVANGQTLYQWGIEDQGKLLGYTEGGKALLILSNKDANALRLLRLDSATGKSRVIAEDPQYDVAADLEDGHGVFAIEFEKEKPEWAVLDPRYADDFKALAEMDSGVFSVGGRRGDTWLVTCYADNAPSRYCLYDRTTKRCNPLFSANDKLTAYQLAKQQPISFTARDGLLIHGYLTLPVGLPEKGLPLVLLVHGGPWDRDHWQLNARAQWLANRGYAVLQVNYRGSTGYGKSFLQAGNHGWGGAMQDDLTDGVKWAIAQGIADPQRVAIMGSSYGGYAALYCLAFTPDLYAAGIDLSGPSDLVALREYRQDIRTPFGTPENVVIGNPATERAFLTARSPSSAVGNIRAPLLIGQGANDPRVPWRITDTLVAALRQAGKPVQYIVYADEGHGLAREANQLYFYAQAEALLAVYLGGRCEPEGTIIGHSGVEK